MLMNVQTGDTCVQLCGTFLSMFHTCTSMTWSHDIIKTRGETQNSLDPDLHAQHFFFFFNSLHFLLSLLILLRLISAFEKLLNRIRQEGKSFFFFSFQRAAPPQNQTGFSSTSDHRRGVKSLAEFEADGEPPCRLGRAV